MPYTPRRTGLQRPPISRAGRLGSRSRPITNAPGYLGALTPNIPTRPTIPTSVEVPYTNPGYAMGFTGIPGGPTSQDPPYTNPGNVPWPPGGPGDPRKPALGLPTFGHGRIPTLIPSPNKLRSNVGQGALRGRTSRGSTGPLKSRRR